MMPAWIWCLVWILQQSFHLVHHHLVLMCPLQAVWAVPLEPLLHLQPQWFQPLVCSMYCRVNCTCRSTGNLWELRFTHSYSCLLVHTSTHPSCCATNPYKSKMRKMTVPFAMLASGFFLLTEEIMTLLEKQAQLLFTLCKGSLSSLYLFFPCHYSLWIVHQSLKPLSILLACELTPLHKEQHQSNALNAATQWLGTCKICPGMSRHG